MTNRKFNHVAVLMGGSSTERDVSLKTGAGCAQALREAGYSVVEIEIDHTLPQQLLQHKPQACFMALHGVPGEDGSVQGLLEVMGIAYTHSGVATSALCINKLRTNTLLRQANIPVAASGAIDPAQLQQPATMPLPAGVGPSFVLKPADGGSSIGVLIVHDQSLLTHAQLPAALVNSSCPMAEQYIAGRELSVGVLHGRALAVTEIVTQSDGFYDFAAKYGEDGAKHVLPAPLPQHVSDTACRLAEQVYQLLGCKTVSRIDFRYNESHNGTDSRTHGLYVLEVNTHPGMTAQSLLPEQAALCNISYANLVCMLMEDASCQRPIEPAYDSYSGAVGASL